MRDNQLIPDPEFFLQMVASRADLLLHGTHHADIDEVAGHFSLSWHKSRSCNLIILVHEIVRRTCTSSCFCIRHEIIGTVP
jgi:hypothetical protein